MVLANIIEFSVLKILFDIDVPCKSFCLQIIAEVAKLRQVSQVTFLDFYWTFRNSLEFCENTSGTRDKKCC